MIHMGRDSVIGALLPRNTLHWLVNSDLAIQYHVQRLLLATGKHANLPTVLAGCDFHPALVSLK